MLASELSVPSAVPTHPTFLYPPFATTSVTPDLYNPPVIRDPSRRALPSISAAASASATLPTFSSPRASTAFSASAPLPVSPHSPWSFTNRQYPGGGSAYNRHYVPLASASSASSTAAAPFGATRAVSSPSSSSSSSSFSSPRSSRAPHEHERSYLSPHAPAPHLVPHSTSPSSASSASPQSYGARGAADGPVQLSGSSRFLTGVVGATATSSPRAGHMERSLVPPKYPGSSFLIDQSLPSVTGPRVDELPEYVSNGLVHRSAALSASSRSPRAATAGGVTARSFDASVAGAAAAGAGGEVRVATGFGLDGSCRKKECFITRFQSHSIANRYRDRTQSAYA